MASQSSKKTAASNAATLKELHLISILINVLSLLSLFFLQRPSSKWMYFVFSLPAVGCQLVLEKSGRPVYSLDPLTNVSKLIKPGNDIKGPGLFEYMFDCIYITWLCDILMILFGSNKAWAFILVVPGFMIYKTFTLVKYFLGSSSGATQKDQDNVTRAGNGQPERTKQTGFAGRRQPKTRKF